MKTVDEILEMAAANGWEDNCSLWKRQGVVAQISTLIDGWQATVTTLVNGDITWAITPDTAQGRPQRGKADSVDKAMDTAREAVSNRLGVLF
jgi:hypothetical protein